ncbi:MAG: AbrB/MazE/SpoVT family DNA-binding domain-containing protein [bacterium]
MKKLSLVKKRRRISSAKLIGRGGDKVLTLRHLKTLQKVGNNGGTISIPVSFLKNLNWKPGETEVYIGLTDDGKVLLEPAAKPAQEKTA